MKKSIFILALFSCLPAISFAQDYIYTQYFNTPLLLNPALTGHMREDFRATLSYRNQWSSISQPFVTSALFYDMTLLKRRTNQNHLGVGGYLLSDKAGTSKMGLFQAAGSFAYQLSINDYNVLSTGMQIGYSQRSITVDGLTWDNQFNGVGYDPALSSGEQFSNTQQSFIDASAGIFWEHQRKIKYSFGYAMWHYGQNQSFLAGSSDKFLSRHVAHANITKNGRIFDLTTRIRAQVQSGALEVSGGIQGKYRVGMDSRYTTYRTSSALMVGLFYRHKDALSPMLGYEFKRMAHIWISYDINVSSLQVASAYRGGWEIQLIYRGHLTDRRIKLK